MKTGCIFDLDGTLIDSIEDLSYSCNEMLEHFNFETHSVEEYRIFVGNGVKKLVERALPQDCLNYFDEALALFYKIYEKRCLENTHCYPGIISLLEQLKQLNIPVAVVSNKPHYLTQKIVNNLFGDLVTVVYGQQEGILVKPHPELVFKAAKQMNITLSQSFYIGDSDVDMLTAKNANMISIGCTWGNRSEKELIENGANHIATYASELLDIICQNISFVLVSNCLLGVNCKWNGENNYRQCVVDFLKNYNYIGICPEQMGGLSTPRIPSEISKQYVINQKNEDVTNYFKKGANDSLHIVEKYKIKNALFKAKSPSCGNEQVYDGTFSHILVDGAGICAQLLMEHGVCVFNENQLEQLNKSMEEK